MEGGYEDGGNERGGEEPAWSRVAPRPSVRQTGNPPNDKGWPIPPTGPFSRLSGRFNLLRHWVVQSYISEIAAGNRFSWYVVAFAVGAAIYLVLPQEPSFWALTALLAVGCGGLAIRRRTTDEVFVLTLGVMLIAGVWAGSLKSIRVAAPRLDHERTVTVSGWIVDEETVLNGATRMTIKVSAMTGRRLPSSAIPKSITVTFRANTPSFAVGAGIQFLARLQPLQGPVMPGGYDFARRAFFDGRGATGYALGRVTAVDLGLPDWLTRMSGAVSDLRHRMSQRIRAALPGAEGAIAAAIIVGEQRGIPDAENDALRMSGLPHMITIAGLHMSIVAGCVFIVVRWLLALFPAVALRFPIKTWAAGGALAATTFYMLISGGHLSAERAYIMGAIMLIAVMLGRPALTMRNLGIAAIILLIYNPAQVIEPGFLMSFLAVMALIAAYRAWAQFRASRPREPIHDHGPIGHVLRGIGAHGFGIIFSTLIATVATASVTADQFFRVSPYSALSNIIVFPAIDMVAMPAAVLACLAMPFGLEALPLTVMGWAIDFMDTIGSFASHLPGGNGLVGRIHPWSNALEITGLCWLCLWHRRWRLLGGLPVLLALVLAPFADRPDVFIGPNGLPVAVRDGAGQLKVLGSKQNRFTVANWLTADAAPNAPADPRAPLDPHLGDGWACDTLRCIFTLPSTGSDPMRRVAVVTNAQAFDEDCARADIIVTRLAAPPECAETALVFDRDRLASTGAVALTFKPVSSSRKRETIPDESAAGPIDLDDSERRQPLDVRIAVALPDRSRPWVPSLETEQIVAPVPAVAQALRKPETPPAISDPDAAESPALPPQTNANDLLIHPASATKTANPSAKPRKASSTGFLLNPMDMPDMPDP